MKNSCASRGVSQTVFQTKSGARPSRSKRTVRSPPQPAAARFASSLVTPAIRNPRTPTSPSGVVAVIRQPSSAKPSSLNSTSRGASFERYFSGCRICSDDCGGGRDTSSTATGGGARGLALPEANAPGGGGNRVAGGEGGGEKRLPPGLRDAGAPPALRARPPR